MSDVLMPKLSDTMEEGTIVQWMIADGETAERGQPLVEIETDKANMIVDASESGVLRVIAGEGDVLAVGEPIASIGAAAANEDAPADVDAAPVASAAAEPEASEPASEAPSEPATAQAQDEPAEAADEPREATAPEEEDTTTGIPVSDDGTGDTIGLEQPAEVVDERAVPAEAAEQVPPAEAGTASPIPGGDDRDADPPRVAASPLARSLARRQGIDLGTVTGTGPGGRIVKADVEATLGDGPAPESAPAAATPAPSAPAPREDANGGAPAPAPGAPAALSRLQQTVARRMVESTTQAPHFRLERDVDVTELLALRAALKAAAPEDRRPSVNDLIVRAVALAVVARPRDQRRYTDAGFVQPKGVHVGIAVAVDEGLLVPVVRDADTKSVGQIAAETRDLAARAGAGSLTPAELEGSTVSISNLGMFGIDRFTAIINPPESSILAVGRAAPAAVVRDGEIVVRDLMTLTLSVDHRALYGADGAEFLGRIAELLEMPHRLVI